MLMLVLYIRDARRLCVPRVHGSINLNSRASSPHLALHRDHTRSGRASLPETWAAHTRPTFRDTANDETHTRTRAPRGGGVDEGLDGSTKRRRRGGPRPPPRSPRRAAPTPSPPRAHTARAPPPTRRSTSMCDLPRAPPLWEGRARFVSGASASRPAAASSADDKKLKSPAASSSPPPAPCTRAAASRRAAAPSSLWRRFGPLVAVPARGGGGGGADGGGGARCGGGRAAHVRARPPPRGAADVAACSDKSIDATSAASCCAFWMPVCTCVEVLERGGALAGAWRARLPRSAPRLAAVAVAGAGASRACSHRAHRRDRDRGRPHRRGCHVMALAAGWGWGMATGLAATTARLIAPAGCVITVARSMLMGGFGAVHRGPLSAVKWGPQGCTQYIVHGASA